MQQSENIKLRRTNINGLQLVISSCNPNDESRNIAYEFTKKLFVGVCKRSELYCNDKYNLSELPFGYRERQLDSVVLPQMARMCKGLVIAEYPVNRQGRGKRLGEYDSRGRIDYWCIYKDYSFAIEMKHSYDAFETSITKDEGLIQRWQEMTRRQLADIKEDLVSWEEHTKGIIRLGLHFITPYKHVSKYPAEDYHYYSVHQKDILYRLYNDVSKRTPSLTTPDFMASWVMEERIVESYAYDETIPGLMLIAKFFPSIEGKR